MGGEYNELLEATIQHLELLKERGVRFVPVSKTSLDGLAAAPQARPARAPRPALPAARPAPPVPARPVAAAAAARPVLPTEAGGKMPSAPPLEGQAREAAFAELRARVLACETCGPLAQSRRNVVFGAGNIFAELMLIGEAPGADEDRRGEPFVGPAGMLLDKILQAMGLTRESVYIANILKCRPDTPGQTSGNRKPSAEEMRACLPYLHEQIDLIRPRVLVALGATAALGLLGLDGITRLRGRWQIYRGIPLMPTYHPAYLLRNTALSEKRRVWEDMLQVMDRLGLPISERQRGFFRKG